MTAIRVPLPARSRPPQRSTDPIRVALVNPEITSTPLPELSLAYLSAYLRADGGADVRVFDANARPDGNTGVIRDLDVFKPDVVGATAGYSANHTQYVEFLEMLASLSPRPFVVVGGNHATNLPLPFLLDQRANVVAIGEGELTLADIAGRLATGRDWRAVPGIAWIEEDGETLRQTASRPVIADLDSLPFPAFDLLPYDYYRSVERLVPTMLYRGSVASWFIQERGCPYPCTYCAASTVFGKRPRYPSIDRVLDLLAQQIDYFGLNHVCFWDDIFTFKRQRIIDLCDAIARRGLDLVWGCQTRVDCVDEDLIQRMARAGCAFIEYGVETPTQELSHSLGKRLSVERIQNAIEMTDRAGITMQINLLVGSPGETESTMKAAIDFGRNVLAQFHALPCYWTATALPGTVMYDEVVREHGYVEFRNTSPTADVLDHATGYLPRDLEHSAFSTSLRDAWTQDESRVKEWFVSNRLLQAALQYSGLNLDGYLEKVFPGRIGDFVDSTFFTTSFDRAAYWDRRSSVGSPP